jgi:hypothetical protein
MSDWVSHHENIELSTQSARKILTIFLFLLLIVAYITNHV